MWSLVLISMWCGLSQDCIFLTGLRSLSYLIIINIIWTQQQGPRRYITYSWREGENIVHLQQLVSPCLLQKLKTKFPINIKIFRFLHELNESDNAGLIQSIWHWCENFVLKMSMVDLCARPIMPESQIRKYE